MTAPLNIMPPSQYSPRGSYSSACEIVLIFSDITETCRAKYAVQSQKAVTSHLKNKQLPSFDFAEQVAYCDSRWNGVDTVYFKFRWHNQSDQISVV